jgi:hypothetical protein
MTDLIRDDDLVKRLDEGCIQHARRWSGDTHTDLGGSVDEEATDAVMKEAARRIEALQAEVADKSGIIAELRRHAENEGNLYREDEFGAPYFINHRAVRAEADADRRVEEEREAIAQWHDEQAKMYAERAQSAVEIGDHDLNSLMADHSQHHMMSASAIRSRSTREQVSDSSTACSTAAAPISQDGSIAPEALSEGGE